MEVGFTGARVEEIARRAKANKAMIYYHFSSKKGLYRVVIVSLFEGVLAEIRRLEASPLPARDKLRALYTRIGRHFEENRALPPIMLRELLAGGENIDAEASRSLGMILSFVRATVREGVEAGAFKDVHPLIVHVTVLGPLMLQFAGASFRDRLLPRELPGLAPPQNAEVLAHLLEVLDRSLAPAAGGASTRSRQRKPK